MGAIVNQATEALMAANNTLMVGPKMKYRTIQAGVTAATAVYTATGTRQLVVGTRGVQRDYIPATGVDVVFEDDLAALGILNGYGTRVAGPTPRLLSSPYGNKGLICLIVDDGGNGLLTAAGGGCAAGVTPAAYARDNGVPLTQAIPVGNIGATNYLTAAQIRTLVHEYGHEIMAHGYVHGTPTLTQAYFDKETRGAVEALEALVDATMTTGQAGVVDTTNIGLRVKGFVQPGDWSSGVPLLDGVDKATNWVGRLIQANFEHSTAYIGIKPMIAPMEAPVPRHFAARMSLSASSTPSYLMGLTASPGARTIVTLHATASIPLPSTAGYSFKELIDAIVVARAAGSVEAVTASALFDMQPSGLTEADMLTPYGDFDDWASVTDAAYQYGWYCKQYGTSAITLETHGAGKALQLAHGGDNYWDNVLYAALQRRLGPGTWRLRFDGMCTTDAGALSLDISHYKGTGTGRQSHRRTVNLAATGGDWVNDIDVLFTVPSWAESTRLWFGEWNQNISSAVAPANKGLTVQIDNVRLMRA